MKKIAFPLFCLFLAAGLAAQQLPKKYVLIEHFTNSNCPACANKNPAFYNLIDDYPNDVHHISYHPPIPYASCHFYQQNPTENQGMATFYGISGTPQVALNGLLLPPSSQLLPAAKLEAELNKTSPIRVVVAESGTGAARNATVTIQSVGTPPAGDYVLCAFLAEKVVNYQGTNTESVHYDVFRRMLPTASCQAIMLPAEGSSTTVSIDYTLTASEDPSQAYVLAYVRNSATDAVLNSGTRFDAAVSATGEAHTQTLQLTPNPAQDQTLAVLSGDRALKVEVFSSAGRRVATDYSVDQDQVTLATVALPTGVYFVKISGEKSVYVGKLMKI